MQPKNLVYVIEVSRSDGYLTLLGLEDGGVWWTCRASIDSNRQARITTWEKVTTYAD